MASTTLSSSASQTRKCAQLNPFEPPHKKAKVVSDTSSFGSQDDSIRSHSTRIFGDETIESFCQKMQKIKENRTNPRDAQVQTQLESMKASSRTNHQYLDSVRLLQFSSYSRILCMGQI